MSETVMTTRAKRSLAEAEAASAAAVAAPRSRSTRAKTVEEPDYKSMSAEELFWTGYGRFNAKEVEKITGGTKDCHATLHFCLSDGTSGVVVGSTGKGCGHAEVHAAYLFVGRCKTPAAYREFQHIREGIRMECTGKTVCIHCAAFLGLLRIKAYDEHTKKCRDPMGSTEWSMPQRLMTFMGRLLNVTPEHLIGFRSADTRE